jgi:hypothetical protein
MKVNPMKYLKVAGAFLKKHDATILAGMAIAGVGSTIAAAIVGTKKSVNEIKPEMTKKEKAKVYVKNYAPTALAATSTVACIVGSRTVSYRKEAMLAAAYKLSEETYKEYVAKTKEVLGKDDIIRDSIAQDHVDKTAAQNPEVLATGNGDTLFLDKLCGRYFRSDIEVVKRAEYDFMHQLATSLGWGSLNDLYYLMDLEPTVFGEDLGWEYTNPPSMRLSSCLFKEKEPCIVIDFTNRPAVAQLPF